MKTRSEITKSVTLMTETDTLIDAMSFALEATDEIGKEVNIFIKFRITPGEEGERQVYYGVQVVSNTYRPEMLGNENE